MGVLWLLWGCRLTVIIGVSRAVEVAPVERDLFYVGGNHVTAVALLGRRHGKGGILGAGVGATESPRVLDAGGLEGDTFRRFVATNDLDFCEDRSHQHSGGGGDDAKRLHVGESVRVVMVVEARGRWW